MTLRLTLAVVLAQAAFPVLPAHTAKSDRSPGAHLHSNDAGYQAMVDAADLSIFTRR
jgi:hypothetical protein